MVVDLYAEATEETVSTGGNDFGWALRALKNGAHVTRLAWHEQDQDCGDLLGAAIVKDGWLVLGSERFTVGPRTLVESGSHPLVKIHGPHANPPHGHYWHPPHDDFFAEDWVLASDVKAGGT